LTRLLQTLKIFSVSNFGGLGNTRLVFVRANDLFGVPVTIGVRAIAAPAQNLDIRIGHVVLGSPVFTEHLLGSGDVRSRVIIVLVVGGRQVKLLHD
jgi:hypothetical protein